MSNLELVIFFKILFQTKLSSNNYYPLGVKSLKHTGVGLFIGLGLGCLVSRRSRDLPTSRLGLVSTEGGLGLVSE